MRTNKIVLGLFLITTLFFSCSEDTETTTEETQVLTSTVSTGQVQVKVEGPAVFEAYRLNDIRSQVGSSILSIASQGDQFKEGDIIVEMAKDDLENSMNQALLSLEQAQVDKRRAVIAREQAASDLAEKKSLYEQGAIAADQYKAAETAYNNALLSEDSAEIKVKQAELAYNNALKAVNSADLLAPYDGVVLETYVSQGEIIGNGAMLLQFADLSKLRLKAEVDEFDIGRVSPGLKVTVTSDILEDAKSSVVERISPAAEIVNNISIFTVTSVIDNEDNVFRPGMSADMSIMIASDKGIVVPSKTVQTVRGRSYIKVIEDGEVVTRRIEIGANDGVNVAVLDGLTEEDIIVLPDAPTLSLPGATTEDAGTSIVPISVPGSGSK